MVEKDILVENVFQLKNMILNFNTVRNAVGHQLRIKVGYQRLKMKLFKARIFKYGLFGNNRTDDIEISAKDLNDAKEKIIKYYFFDKIISIDEVSSKLNDLIKTS